MQSICAKLLLIKAGSAVTLINENSETYEFKLLQDFEVKIPCEDFYKIEKQGIIHPEESTCLSTGPMEITIWTEQEKADLEKALRQLFEKGERSEKL